MWRASDRSKVLRGAAVVAVAAAAIVVATTVVRAEVVRLAARGPDLAITVDELRDEIRDSRRSGDMARMAATLTAEGLGRIIASLADQKRLAAEARRRGIDRTPEVAREIESVTNALLADALEGHVRATVDSSPEAVQAFYDAHAELFRTPGRRKARHIVVATRAEAIAALEAFNGGASFDDLARERNVDSTRKTGGELGWVPRGLMVPGFEDLLFATRVGEVGGPIETRQGWHLVIVDEVDPGTLPELPLIESTVVETMKQQAVTGLRARLREAQPIVIDADAIEELLK